MNNYYRGNYYEAEETGTEESKSSKKIVDKAIISGIIEEHLRTHFTIEYVTSNNAGPELHGLICWLNKYFPIKKYLIPLRNSFYKKSVTDLLKIDNLFFRPNIKIFKKIDKGTFLLIKVMVPKEKTFVGNEIKVYFIGKHIGKLYDEFIKYVRKEEIPLGFLSILGERMCSFRMYYPGPLSNFEKLKKGYHAQQPQYDKIISYVETSMRFSSMMYEKYDVDCSSGILLYGEPGTGKTFLTKLIASKYNMQMLLVTTLLSGVEQEILDWRNDNKGNRLMIVIEDIDRLLEGSDKSKKEHALMQLFDGFLSWRDTIIVITTNHLDQLNPALIRAGRFDLKIELPLYEKEDALELCKIYGGEPEWVENLKYPLPVANVKQKIIECMRDREIMGGEC